MKKCILILCLFGFLLVTGCRQKKEIQLTPDTFPEFCKLKFTKVYISTGTRRGGYEYYIDDPKKVEVIKLCLQRAKHMKFDLERLSKMRETQKNENLEMLIFETRNTMYSLQFCWNDEFVYGFWWESAPLLKVFEKWQLFEELSKADPAWPVFTLNYPTDTNTFRLPPYDRNEPNNKSIEPNESIGLML
ncbi:MAG: hypothetical protein WC496_10585 [Phycisphaerae bacterium]|jgi:hypothetical protein